MAKIDDVTAELKADLRDWKRGFKQAERVSKRSTDRIGKMAAGLRSKLNRVGGAVFSLRGALASLGTGIVIRSFIKAADTTEKYNLTLRKLLGSTREGNKVFQDMVTLAGRLPFEFEEIMGAAVGLAGVVKGGSKEINQLIPIIADIAATWGLSIQDTTNNVIRMLSAGAAAADQFRDRGILAALGFQAGVAISAKETKKQLIAAWEDTGSKFRGVTKDLARTWTGLTSMMADKWFAFRNVVMEGGIFNFIKALATVIDKKLGDAIDSSRGKAKSWSLTLIAGMEFIIKGMAIVANAFWVLARVWTALKISFQGWKLLILQGLSDIAAPLNRLGERLNRFLGKERFFRVDFGGLNASILETRNRIEDLKKELDEGLLGEIPTETVKRLLKEVREEFEKIEELQKKTGPKAKKRRKGETDTLKELREEYKKLRKELGSSFLAAEDTEERVKKLGEALRAGLIDNMDEYIELLLKATGEWERFEKNQEEGLQDLISAVKGWGDEFTDALLDIAETGKFSFKDLTASILRDIARIIIHVKMVKPIIDFVLGRLGGLGGAAAGRGLGGGTRGGGGPKLRTAEHGGRVPGRRPVIVGERRPEVFVPDVPGRIEPRVSSGPSVTVIQHISVSAGVSQTVQAEMLRLLPEMQEQSRQGVIDAIHRGGETARVVGRRR